MGGQGAELAEWGGSGWWLVGSARDLEGEMACGWRAMLTPPAAVTKRGWPVAQTANESRDLMASEGGTGSPVISTVRPVVSLDDQRESGNIGR